jgi:hypothetical protein
VGALNPLLLLGLLAVAVPIAVHLINRRKAARHRFPAIRLLLESDERIARAMKLKQWLLLAARVLLFVLLPLAFAQPYLLRDTVASGISGDRLPATVVVVLDDSASMSWSSGGDGRWEQAVKTARERIEDLRPWDQVALLVASDPPAALVGDPTEDHGRVLEALAEFRPAWAGSDLAGALRLARDIQRAAKLPNHRTVVVSDATATTWGQDGLNEAVAGLGDLDVVSLGLGEGSGNLAITSVKTMSAEDGAAGSHRLEATITAAGIDRPSKVPVRLLDGDRLIATTFVDVPAHGRATAVVTQRFEDAGLHRLRFELDEPAGLRSDNVRHVAFEPGRALRALLVDGDMRSVSFNDELYYLDRALSVGSDAARAIELTTIAPDALAATDLERFDVAVLANVAAPAVAEARRLEEWVSAGHGLLLSTGSNTREAEWNAALGPLLPKPIRTIKVLSEPSDPDAGIKATRISTIDRSHPVFRVFDLPGGQTIQSALVYRYALLEPSAVEGVTQLAAYADGAPAIVERRVGQGRVALLTTTVDLDWNDLPIRTAYLPMMRRLVSYLARQSGDTRAEATVGQRLVLDVESLNPERLAVIAADGARTVVSIEAGKAGFVPPGAGTYEVLAEVGGVESAVPSLAFSAHAPPDESRLAAFAPEAIERIRLAAAGSGAPRSPGDVPAEARRDLWPLLLFGALVLMYAETLLQVRRRLWERLNERLSRLRAVTSRG